MENKYNFKKLLCYNIVNNFNCIYKNKCMFAHTLDEQKKEPLRQYINDMIYEMYDLSLINICKNKILFDELIILTKECKNCINKKCPGGHNCKFGTCLRDNKICYNDLMYGKCYNVMLETKNNDIIIHRCIHGIHLSERNLIPYNQRMLYELTNMDKKIINNDISFNSKNNIISLNLNDKTIKIVKDITCKISKIDIIDNLKIINNMIIENKDDKIFDEILDSNNTLQNFNNYKLDFDNKQVINNNIIIVKDNDEINKITHFSLKNGIF